QVRSLRARRGGPPWPPGIAGSYPIQGGDGAPPLHIPHIPEGPGVRPPSAAGLVREQKLLEDHPVDAEEVVENFLEALLQRLRAAPFEEGGQEDALLLAQIREQAIVVVALRTRALGVGVLSQAVQARGAPVDEVEGVEELEIFDAERRQQPLQGFELGQPAVLVFRQLALADAGFLGDLALALAAELAQEAKGQTEVMEHLHAENLSAIGVRVQA